MRYVALSNTVHADLKFTQRTFFHLLDQPMVAISVVEAPRAALDLPLAFSRRPDHSLFLAAILSLEKGENPHISPQGLWMGGYMPAVINGYPFALAFKEEKAVVVFDEDSGCLSPKGDKPLFDDKGNPTELLDELTRLLKNRYPNPHRDNPVLEAIDRLGVLEPWSDISENLLRVNPRLLTELEDRSFLELRQNNVLGVIYAHLMSLPRINRIKNMAKRKENMVEQAQKQPRAEIDYDADMIRFF